MRRVRHSRRRPGRYGGAAVLVVLAGVLVGLFSSAASGSSPTLVFTTSAQTLTAGMTSAVITVERRDLSGNAATTGDMTVDLTADSTTGTFRDSADTGDITTVTILDTQSTASFKYVDTTAGTPTITAADDAAAFAPATQPETVNPGPFNGFDWNAPSSQQPASSQVAGTAFSAKVSAVDAYGNVVPTYDGSTAQFSGLDDAPNHTHNASYSPGWAGGVATLSATTYKTAANPPGVAITVSDTSGPSATSHSFQVDPNTLAGFDWDAPSSQQPASSQVAGTAFSAKVSAVDAYGNVVPTYDGSTAQFSGLDDAPNHTHNASYSPGWAGGVATLSAATYKTAANPPGVAITVSDTGVPSATSHSFKVDPGPIGTFDWSTQQPGSSQLAGAAFPAKVTAIDAYGNIDTTYDGSTAQFSGLDNAPNHTHNASYSPGWAGGVATLSATTYKTAANPPGVAITVSDTTGPSGTSDAFTVGPGPLGSFDWSTQQPTSPQTAGTTFPTKVTAVDQFGNVKTDYTGSTATFSGLENAPNGTQTASYGVSWGSGTGVATLSAKTYKTEVNPPGIGITVTDTGGIYATSNTFGVNPGPLGSFDWTVPTSQPPGPSQLAGTSFGAKVTAVDTYGNVKTDYPGTDTPTFTGLHDAPNGSHTASYAVTWTGGVASGSFTGYRTEPGPLPGGGTALTVKNGAGTIQAISSKFVVDPADPATINFLCASLCREPVETQVNAIINNGLVPPGVRALISDGFGNAAYNSQVNAFLDNQAVAITGNPTGGTFTLSYVGSPTAALPFNATATQVQNAMNAVGAVSSAGGVTVTGGALPGLPLLVSFNQAGAHNLFTHADSLTGGSSPAVTITRSVFTGGSTTTVAANSSGIAVLTNLAIPTTAAGYRISASASRTPTSTITANGASVPFTVAQAVNPCTGSTCSASASVPNNTTVSVTANGATSGNTLGVALFGAVIPPGVCSGFTPVAGVPLSFVNLNLLSTGGQHPTLTLTWTLAKAIVNAQPDNGAAHYNMCLGAVNLANPQNSPPIQGFVTKSGARATPVPDPLFGVTLFWGILGNCNKVPAGNPCVVSRGKDSAGNLIFVYQVAYPWDPNGSLG